MRVSDGQSDPVGTCGFEIRCLEPTLEPALLVFFGDVASSGDYEHFHPHPFTPEEAQRRIRYVGEDLYYVMLEEGRILGYGMLRGWDEGYDVPSLGIIIHPKARGQGLGKIFMRFLHMAGRRKGARRVRLKVYPDNQRAVALYEACGYVFRAEEAGQLVGFLDLEGVEDRGGTETA